MKTRLSADLGERQVLTLYKNLIEHTLSKVCKNNFNVALHCYPDTQHPFFDYCQDKYNVTLYSQDGEDLGVRMHNAIKRHLNQTSFVVLIGSDCPQIDSIYINNAFQMLETGSDIVLGPALDGGYVLIGANKISETIFSNINWSTSDVFQTTMQRINTLGWIVSCLPSVRDIDELSDYEYFSRHKDFKYLFLTDETIN